MQVSGISSYQTVYGKPSKGKKYAYWPGYDHALTAASEGMPEELLKFAARPFSRSQNGSAMVAKCKRLEGALFLKPLRIGPQSYFVISWLRAFSEGGQSENGELNEGRYYTLVNRTYFQMEDWQEFAPDLLHEYLARVSIPLPTLTDNPAGVTKLPQLTWLTGDKKNDDIKEIETSSGSNRIKGTDMLVALQHAPVAIHLDYLPDQADFLNKCAGAMTRMPKAARGLANFGYGLKFGQNDIGVTFSEDGGTIPDEPEYSREKWKLLARDFWAIFQKKDHVKALMAASSKMRLREYLESEILTFDPQTLNKDDAQIHAMIVNAFWNKPSNEGRTRALKALKNLGFPLYIENFSTEKRADFHLFFEQEGDNGKRALRLHKRLFDKKHLKHHEQALTKKDLEKLANVYRPGTDDHNEKEIAKEIRALMFSTAERIVIEIIKDLKKRSGALPSDRIKSLLEVMGRKDCTDILLDHVRTTKPHDVSYPLTWIEVNRSVIAKQFGNEGTGILDNLADVLNALADGTVAFEPLHKATRNCIIEGMQIKSEAEKEIWRGSLWDAHDRECPVGTVLKQIDLPPRPQAAHPDVDVPSSNDRSVKPRTSSHYVGAKTHHNSIPVRSAPSQEPQPQALKNNATTSTDNMIKEIIRQFDNADDMFMEIKRLFDHDIRSSAPPKELTPATKGALLATLKEQTENQPFHTSDPNLEADIENLKDVLREHFSEMTNGPFSIQYPPDKDNQPKEYGWIFKLHNLFMKSEWTAIDQAIMRDRLLLISFLLNKDADGSLLIRRKRAPDTAYDRTPKDSRIAAKQILLTLIDAVLEPGVSQGAPSLETDFLKVMRETLGG